MLNTAIQTKLADKKSLTQLRALSFVGGIILSVGAQAMGVHAAGKTEVASIVVPWMQKNQVPGVAVEVYQNGVPHSYYFGVANKQTKIPVTSGTIFELGSLTKLFTSLVMAEQVNANAIQLTTSVASSLSDLAPKGSALAQVTFLNLATHTAGLPFNLPQNLTSRLSLEQYFATWQPRSAIGTQWAYSNAGFGLLGQALETVTHQSFNQQYRQNILSPLGMEPMGLTVPKRQMPFYAQGYDANGMLAPKVSSSDFPSAGAMKASAQDMLQFLKAALMLPGVPSTIVSAMKMTQTPYFLIQGQDEQGLAWEIHPNAEQNKVALLNPAQEMVFGPLPAKALSPQQQQFDATALIDKTGATKGFRSYIAVIPQENSGVVILANHNVSNGELVKLGRVLLFSGTL